MVLCNVCVEMGFHFDEIFEEQLHYKLESVDMTDLNEAPRTSHNNESTPKELPYERGYKHHASYNALVRSAALGCELCRVFACGSVHLSPPRLAAPCSELIHQNVLKAEVDNEADPTEMQIYVVGRKARKNSPWFGGVAAVEVYFGDRKVFNAARVFCCDEDPLAFKGIVVERPLFIRTLKDAVSILGKLWLQKCLRGHEKCHSQPDSVLPTRIIDVGRANPSLEPCIVSPPEGSRGSWIALSHCWGGKIPQMTTTLNISARENCLPLKDLPATFIEAILITRDLGFQYLWIDSICIIQDSISDWDHEASRMKHIYKNATITLAATMAPNSNAGIARFCSTPISLFPIPINYESQVLNISGTLHFKAFKLPKVSNLTHFPRGPLTERAWTVQEKVLSPRTIHFGEEELVWDCNACVETSEDSYSDFWGFSLMEITLQERTFEPTTFPKESSEVVHWREDLLHRWYKIICEYGIRQLSFEADKFPAISGVAKEVASRMEDTYLAGLWRNDLHRGLLWSFDGEDVPPEQYLAPSWSWAAVAYHSLVPTGRRVDLYRHTGVNVIDHVLRQSYYYPANKFYLWKKHDEYDVKIHACGFESNRSDKFGQISSGCLTLEGWCIPAVECGVEMEQPGIITALTFRRGCVDNIFGRRGSESKHIYCVFDGLKHHSGRDLSTWEERGEGVPVEADGVPGPSVEENDTEIVAEVDSESDTGSDDYDSEDSRAPEHDCRGVVWELSPKAKIRVGSIFIQISMWSGMELRISSSSPILFALLLEPTDILGEYRRRGLANVPHFDDVAVNGWEKRIVKIV